MPSQWRAASSGVRSFTHVGGTRDSKNSANSWTLAATLWVFGCGICTLLLLGGCGNKNVSAAAAPPPNVQIAEVIQRDIPIYHEYLATLDGFVNAQIQPQVSGDLIRQNYVEGAVVSKNQVLFKIDPRPFQAIVDQARAQVAQAEAQLGKTQLDVHATFPWPKKKQSRRASWTTIFKPISPRRQPSRPTKLHWNRPN